MAAHGELPLDATGRLFVHTLATKTLHHSL
jgi:hypothetical protein